MQQIKHIQRLKGFTLAEVLITLVLTSLAITMSYTTLTYVQKLFMNYKTQNKFINQYTELKNRLDLEAVKATLITEERDNVFKIERDSITSFMEIKDKVILFKRNEACDTFHIEAADIKKEYEPMTNPTWANKLLRRLQFETSFTKQKFNLSFYKEYDGAIKLKLNKEE